MYRNGVRLYKRRHRAYSQSGKLPGARQSRRRSRSATVSASCATFICWGAIHDSRALPEQHLRRLDDRPAAARRSFGAGAGDWFTK